MGWFIESFMLYKINHKGKSIMPVKERTMIESASFSEIDLFFSFMSDLCRYGALLGFLSIAHAIQLPRQSNVYSHKPHQSSGQEILESPFSNCKIAIDRKR